MTGEAGRTTGEEVKMAWAGKRHRGLANVREAASAW
jgi:hypothetical protein